MIEKIVTYFKKYKFEDIPRIDLTSLKRKIKMVVIDDEKDSFPLELVQDFGFTIEHWNTINSNRLKRLEQNEFDVIILDIKGVVDSSLGEKDGKDILKGIKDKNPDQVIIAFSGNKYDIADGEFWQKADGFLNKPISALDAKEELENIIECHFTNNKLIRDLEALLKDQAKDNSSYEKMEKAVATTIMSSSDLDLLTLVKLGVTDTAAVKKVVRTLSDLYKKFSDD